MNSKLAKFVLSAVLVFTFSCGEHGWETDNLLADGGGGGQYIGNVEPLLQTKWAQGSPYNDLFPIVDGSRKATDCVTTAHVQIMKFHRHPARGKGESTAVGPGGIPVPLTSLDVAYDWDNMLNEYTSKNPGNEQQRSAVATLMYHWGLARGSGLVEAKTWVETFGYDKSFQGLLREYYSDAEWEAIIRQQLDLGLPVFYHGKSVANDDPEDYSVESGHGFVVDGYDNTGKFHINWGWSGSRNGWFSLKDIDAGGGKRYNYENKISINIKPDAGSIGSNEMGLMNFTTSKQTVPQNELFTISAKIRSAGFFPGGQAGVALVNNNGNIAAVVGMINNYNAMKPGNTRISTINCSPPATVKAGQYNLRIVTKMNGEDWKIVTHSLPDVPTTIPITVTAETGASGGGYGMTLTDFTVNKTTVSQNGLFIVSSKLKNTNTSAFPAGQVGVALVDNSGYIAAIVGVNNFAALNANATRTSTLNSFAPESVKPGQYKLRIVVRPADGDWKVATLASQNVPNAIDFTVTEERGATGGGYGLSLTNFTSNKTAVSQNELFTVTSTFKNVVLDTFPGGQVGTALVDNSGNIETVVGIINFTTLRAGASRTSTLNTFVPKSVKAGQYKLRTAVKPTGGEWRVATLAPDTIPTAIPFTVTQESGTEGGGYGLALTNFTSNKTSVSQNELFTVISAFKNVVLDTFPGGQVGSALVDNSGNIAAVVGIVNFATLRAGYSRTSTLSSFVPRSVKAGQYKLRAAVRPTGGEWRVATLALQNVPNAIDFTVTSESGAEGGGYGLALTNFTSNKTAVSQNELFTVTSAFKNVVLDTFPAGQAGVALVDNSGNIAAVVGIVNFAALRAGASRTSTLNNFVPDGVEPGQYKLRAVVRPTGGEWRVATLALPDVPTAINLTVTPGEAMGGGYGLSLESFSTGKTSVLKNEQFTVAVKTRNVGLSTFPGGQLGVALINSSGDMEVIKTLNWVELNSNSTRGPSNISGCSVPASGQYRLRIVVRITGGAWKFATLAIDGVQSSIEFTVSE